MAPLKSLTEDFKKLYDKEPTIAPDQVKSIEKKMAKLMEDAWNSKLAATESMVSAVDAKVKRALEKFAVDHQAMADQLQAQIKEMESKCGPRRYTVNRDTGLCHRVLSGFEDVGREAKACCGWRYTRAKVKMIKSYVGDGKDTCDTCFPEYRAMKADLRQ